MAAFYGKVQEAAMSARHLRNVNPQLYWVLYSMQVEMLYFLVEPILPAHITINKNDESEIINFINGIDKLMNFIKNVIKDFFSTIILLSLIAGLWFFYLYFIPEHSVKLIIISIAVIVYIDIKFFPKKPDRR